MSGPFEDFMRHMMDRHNGGDDDDDEFDFSGDPEPIWVAPIPDDLLDELMEYLADREVAEKAGKINLAAKAHHLAWSSIYNRFPTARGYSCRLNFLSPTRCDLLCVEANEPVRVGHDGITFLVKLDPEEAEELRSVMFHEYRTKQLGTYRLWRRIEAILSRKLAGQDHAPDVQSTDWELCPAEEEEGNVLYVAYKGEM